MRVMLHLCNNTLRYVRLHLLLPKVTFLQRFAEGYPESPPLPSSGIPQASRSLVTS